MYIIIVFSSRCVGHCALDIAPVPEGDVYDCTRQRSKAKGIRKGKVRLKYASVGIARLNAEIETRSRTVKRSGP